MRFIKALKAFFNVLLSDDFFVATVEDNNLVTLTDMDLNRFIEISKHVINFAEMPNELETEIKDLLDEKS